MKATVVLENVGDEHNERWAKLIVFDISWDGHNPDELASWCPLTGHSSCNVDYLIDNTIWVYDEVGESTLREYERLAGVEAGSYEYVTRKRFINGLFEEA